MMNSRFFTLVFMAALLAVSPVLAAEAINQTDDAWYWYNSAVDLANAGKFPEALQANEKALAINQNFPLAWANQAGILVQVGRYDDAITAADTVLLANVSGLPMKNTFAAAYYSKADALLALGKVSDAQVNYQKAHELDPTLPIPEILTGAVIPVSASATAGTPVPSGTSSAQSSPSPAAKTPLSPIPVIAGLLVALACFGSARHGKK